MIPIKLFKHQEVSVNRMQEFEETLSNNLNVETRLGFLSDIAGYGKSITIIQLLIDNLMKWDETSHYELITHTSHLNGMLYRKKIITLKRLRSSLILIPKNLLTQWKKELARTNLNVYIVNGLEDIKNFRPELTDVLLCTAPMFNRLAGNYSECVWKRLIVDEPSAVKIPSMKTIYAGFYWFITSTPPLFYTAHITAPHGTFFRDIIGDVSASAFNDIIESVVIRNEEEFVRSCFNMPDTIYVIHECYFDTFKVVKHFITDRVRIMIESGDVRGAVLALGGKTCDNIVDLVRVKKEQEILELDARAELYKIRGNNVMVEELNRRRARIQDQIAGLVKRFDDILKSPCPICMMPLNKPLLESNCQNLFCSHCIMQWLGDNNNCPICRCIIHPESLVLINTNTTLEISPAPQSYERRTKYEVIASIFKDQRRVLIFSESDAPFETILIHLRDKNIKCEKGNNAMSIDEFKRGNIQGLFLNAKTCSTGLDLVEATDVVLFHSMNECMEYQIISRANRIGRTCPLSVHRLQLIV